jgi:hypothetical protein
VRASSCSLHAAVFAALCLQRVGALADPQAVAARAELDVGCVLRIAVRECEAMMRALVQPPAVDPAPWRVRIARGLRMRERCVFFGEQLGAGGGRDDLVRKHLLLRKQRRALALDQPRVEIGGGECATADRSTEKFDVRRRTDDFELAKCRAHASESDLARLAPADELRNHRIVVRRDRIAFAHAAIHAYRKARIEFGCLRCAKVLEDSGRRQKSLVRILRVDPRLDRVPAYRQRLLPQRKRLAGCDAQLPLDKVEAGHHLGHRCSTCSRVFISMKKNSPSAETMNSTVPAPT